MLGQAHHPGTRVAQTHHCSAPMMTGRETCLLLEIRIYMCSFMRPSCSSQLEDCASVGTSVSQLLRPQERRSFRPPSFRTGQPHSHSVSAEVTGSQRPISIHGQTQRPLLSRPAKLARLHEIKSPSWDRPSEAFP
ncbi:uncharacterized protein B0I36DRAFT_116264 [Microdochium trichocladiopsis]|uniref:Uncharacterized protein n=1 Tax=Microdochium trichocladiopsis TaxID=1682393 RepID=A0A9P9BQH5_9PEZI|nr:uncharacterized protein B0I36DRAFT_116264 [Microdochium trichocladiopsis]KAH7030932.1 hypothetical protein B0I36DRAFT_116264 [Microdochium trichocladiopsis]